ncbi:Serine/threonine-protein kinase domain protein [Purpureocillium lavendulum]|uniref:Serine/threonine-protein kinase domain protein n=1 Tax=Purpureocillium lavendulum TaxID=1247861 RepID=A0AB34FE01_9HYPO|nr:Serine/threonine-protein kinase domain protein [Purpureocillium lavendulum]
MAANADHLVDIIFDVHSNHRRIREYEDNAAFLVTEEICFDDCDPYYVPPPVLSDPDDDNTRDQTPAPMGFHESFLRIRMLYKPKDEYLGWTFGSGNTCDIRLDLNSKRNVSAQHFGIKMHQNAGVLLITNRSRHGTLMRSNDDAGFTLVKSQRAFGGETGVSKMTVQLGELAITLSTPDHSQHIDAFTERWTTRYNEFSAQVPPLDSLALSAGPSSTRESIEYYYDRRLGEGISGIVYRAVHRATGKVYAVKNYSNMDHMRREVSLLSRIQHNHIVEIVSYNELRAEIVLEYINGPTLRDAHTRCRFSLAELKTISSQVLDALSYLHGKSITHRDLKLDNIILQRRTPLHVKIIDFNVASDRHQMSTYTGTRRYIAPEVAEGHAYGSKADIWSFGIMIMELFCGLPSLASEWSTDSLHFHVMLRATTVHYGAACFIQNLLTEDPELRPTAEEIMCLEFLQAAMEDEAIALPDLSFEESSSEVSDESFHTIRLEKLPDTLPWGNPHPLDTDDNSPIDESRASTITMRQKRARDMSDTDPEPGRTSIRHRSGVGMNDSSGPNQEELLYQGKESQMAIVRDTHDGYPYVEFLEGGISKRIGMREMDYRLNATDVFQAAALPSSSRQKYLRWIRAETVTELVRGKVRQEGASRRGTWVPFEHGVFLCQCLGLDTIAKDLFMRANRPIPGKGENYLLVLQGQKTFADGEFLNLKRFGEGYVALSCDGHMIFFNVRHRDINVSQMFEMGLGRLTGSFFSFLHGSEKRVVGGGREISGTYLTVGDAKTFCNHFRLPSTPIHKIEAYIERMQVEEPKLSIAYDEAQVGGSARAL